MKCILRTAKLKTMGNIAGATAHNFRTRNTLNADPTKTKDNVLLHGVSADEVLPTIHKRFETLEKKVRKNAVLAVETLLSASPEFFTNKSHDEILEWANESVKSMSDFWGVDNIVSAVLHLDESTPHIHVLSLPIHDNKLNCRSFIGGREKLSKLQTSYSDDMSHFNLKRGVEGSVRRHVTQKELAGRAKEIEMPKIYDIEAVIGRNVIGKKQTEMIDAVNPDDVEPIVAQAKGRYLDSERARAAEKKLDKVTLDNIRSLDLLDVCEKMGYEKDLKESNVYHTPVGKIGIDKNNHSKFYNYTLGIGKGGAIDLIMHCEETDFKNASRMLCDYYGVNAAVTESAKRFARIQKKVVQQKIEIKQPIKDSFLDYDLQKYIVDERKIKKSVFEEWLNKSKVYASKFGKSFQCIFSNEGGYFRKNPITGFNGWVKGSHPQPDIIIVNNQDNNVYICESHIDAMSFQSLFPDKNICFVNGCGGLKSGIKAIKNKGLNPIAALDNDAAAINSIKDTQRIYPKLKSITSMHKDWNDDLRFEVRHPSHLFNFEDFEGKHQKTIKNSHSVDLTVFNDIINDEDSGMECQ